MFRLTILLTALAFALSATVASPVAHADDMSSSTRIKIYRAKLRAARMKAADSSSQALESCQTGNLDIGSIQVERGARVPSEVTVVVDGDVINLNDGRGTHVCR